MSFSRIDDTVTIIIKNKSDRKVPLLINGERWHTKARATGWNADSMISAAVEFHSALGRILCCYVEIPGFCSVLVIDGGFFLWDVGGFEAKPSQRLDRFCC